MVEPKVSLSLLVPGARMLSQQEAENKPSESYNEHKLNVEYLVGKGKKQKRVKETLTFKTRKQKLITQNINICEEAYKDMLITPTSAKLAKSWPTLSIAVRLKHHFDLIAYDLGAESYSFEILDD